MKRLILPLMFVCIAIAGNAQWIPQPSNLTAGWYVQFLDAVDSNVVWGLAADPASQLTPVQEFTKTVDGGNLWIANPISNAAGLSPSGIFGLNADTAWVAMFDGTAGGGKILKTTDGGINWTWQQTALFAAPSGFPNFVYFFDADNGICMGDPTSGYMEIYTTTDGGSNWIRTPQANIDPHLAGEFGITSVYTAYGDSTLWFGTNLGRVYKTTDRGLNWTVASTPYAGSYIGDLAFRDADNGIATNGSPGTASTDIIRTTDGGATWNVVATNTAGILTKVLSAVPGADSTYFLSSPQIGGGTAFTLDDGDSWASVDNLIHSDVEFVNPTTGWTGSNELGAPMFKWTGPIQVSCATLLGPLEFASNDSICAVDSIVYSIHADFTSDPQFRLGFNAVFYDENFIQIGQQSVPNLVAAGFPNSFVPDPGQTTIGTFEFTIFFTLAPANELVHFAIQVFPSQCFDDTSNFIYNSVFQDVSTCAQAVVNGYTASVDMSACPVSGVVNYTYSYSVNGGPLVPGNSFDCIGFTGNNLVTFFIDNGACIKTVATNINCTGVGLNEPGLNQVGLYPNPAQDILHITSFELQGIREVVISDISGRQVYTLNKPVLSGDEIPVPVQYIAPGTYLVTLVYSDFSISRPAKFVKL
jgi:photosystem II stability/assembly factor-like uncharacterized protein